ESKTSNTKISSKVFDIRAVKCWYQGASAWSGLHMNTEAAHPKHVLVPELLLHDASLVKVNYDTKTNYLALSDGKYRDISKPGPQKYPHGIWEGNTRVSIPVKRFPV